jgi:hypothetical protein
MWQPDASLQNNHASMSVAAQLSSVSRTPNHIDVIYPCDAHGVCDASIDNANTYPQIPPGKTPAVTDAHPVPTGLIGVVAVSSYALAATSVIGQAADGASWQVGAGTWAWSYAPWAYELPLFGATQSSTLPSSKIADPGQNSAARAIDHNSDGVFDHDSVATTGDGAGEHWDVQLQPHTVSRIDVYFRSDQHCELNAAALSLLINGQWNWVATMAMPACGSAPYTFSGPWNNVSSIRLTGSAGQLSLAEVQAYGP